MNTLDESPSQLTPNIELKFMTFTPSSSVDCGATTLAVDVDYGATTPTKCDFSTIYVSKSHYLEDEGFSIPPYYGVHSLTNL